VSRPLRALRRVFLFAGIPALGAISPLIVLPALTHALGAPGWASLAVGQSVGAFGALLVNWGWNVEGPSLAAGAAPDDRASLYSASLRSRVLSSVFALPIAMVIAFLVAPSFKDSAAVMAAVVCLSGASPSWFYIGIGSPIRLACFDALPRIGAALVAAPLLLVFPSEWVYPLLLLTVTVTSLAVSTRLLSGRLLHLPGGPDVATARRRLMLVMSGLVSSGYTSLAIPLVAIVSPGAVSTFAAASRFQGFGTLGLGAVTNAAQSWVSAHGATEAHLARRRVTALAANGFAGLVAGIALALGLPVASRLLFSGTVEMSAESAVLVGAIVFMIAVSMSTTYHLLVPTGRMHTVAVSGFATSAVGVPLLLVLAAVWGSNGALIAILVAETVSAGIQLVAYFGPRAHGGATAATATRPARTVRNAA
jgi:hypothetical protein